MEDNTLFVIETKAILAQKGWHNFGSLSALLKGWDGFIAACKKGYENNIYEYDNDLSIRRAIELILSSETLKSYPEFLEFSSQAKSLDAEFSKLLQKGVKRSAHQYWWEQGVLQFAGPELANDFYKNYKITIQIVGLSDNIS